jgi:hypothetical protein
MSTTSIAARAQSRIRAYTEPTSEDLIQQAVSQIKEDMTVGEAFEIAEASGQNVVRVMTLALKAAGS